MAMDLERRSFVAFLGGVLAIRSIPANALPDPAPRTIGVLMGLADDTETKVRAKAFEQGLENDGWVLGETLRIEYRFSGGDVSRMQALATELAALKPDCILAHSTPVVAALMQVTQTIPIVFVAVADPVGSGFVASVARPGGNATGFTILSATITGKYLSILRQLSPRLASVAIIYNPDSLPNAMAFFLQPFIDAAKKIEVEPITAEVRNAADIENAVAALGDKPGSGLIVTPDNFTAVHREVFISLAAEFRIPTIYPYRYYAEAGGLLSYGLDAVDLFKRSSDYVSRILRGAKPADLPVQAPTKFEMVINLKTAKALGLSVPRILLVGADTVIE
jgi:putative tryptophan/tyrosine transport system substrate-binding protein